ncbi:MAG: hypothetical protein A2W22_03895 [Candidatus Levybacteria bacterium RBG_16_35_11]|nr:MAG: hypothetical protein A2W22_03895 [Candidatus Levybacteria bacterium RBG_16_35_11]
MSDVTAVIITKNEEKNIVDCLETLKWVKQIIVIDDFSDDRTADVARINGAEVFKHTLGRDFSKQRNFALAKCKTDWVLFIDADERVSEKLKKEIEYRLSESKNTNGFIFNRKDILWGRTLNHGEMGKVKLLRLAKRESGEWQGKVHEAWKINGNVKELKNPLIHYPHQNITTLFREINFYTSIRAEELRNKNLESSLYQIIFYPAGKFIMNYFIRLGFLDGIPGLIMANAMSMHSFLVRGKLWLSKRNNQK